MIFMKTMWYMTLIFIDTVCNIGTFHVPYYDINTNPMDTAIYSLMMDTSYWINESYEESK